MQIKLKDYLDKIGAEVLTPGEPVNGTATVMIDGGYVSDMLSDVMGTAKEGQVWITIMKHMNSVAVASMTSIPCILFAKDTRPDAAVIDKAVQEGICLAVSDKQAFDLAGILYLMLQG